MNDFARGDSTKPHIEMLAAPRERRVIWRGEAEAHHPEERVQKPLGLAEWQVEDEAESQRSLDGDVGVLQLPSALADAGGLRDRLR